MVDPQHLLDSAPKLPDHPVVAKRGREVDYGLTDRFLAQLTTASQSAISWAEPGLSLPGLLRRVEDVFNTGRLRDEDSDASIERLGFSISDSQGRLPLGQLLAACGVRQTPVEFEADLAAAMVWDPSRRGGRPAYHLAWSNLQVVVSRLHGFKAEGPRLEPPGPRRRGGDELGPAPRNVQPVPAAPASQVPTCAGSDDRYGSQAAAAFAGARARSASAISIRSDATSACLSVGSEPDDAFGPWPAEGHELRLLHPSEGSPWGGLVLVWNSAACGAGLPLESDNLMVAARLLRELAIHWDVELLLQEVEPKCFTATDAPFLCHLAKGVPVARPRGRHERAARLSRLRSRLSRG
jgi:hypothetical protein